MGKRQLTIELDDETIDLLAELGEPITVLSQLAYAAADGVRRPGRRKRDQTDESLRVERDKTDAAIATERARIEKTANDVVRIARMRADEVVRRAEIVDRGERTTRTEATSVQARAVLLDERSTADALLVDQRAEQRHERSEILAVERGSTDRDLIDERAHADLLIVDQREANEHMVRATIRAQDLTIEAAAAAARAVESARQLSAVAEFREMFIGVVGHDLRNPLGSILMSAALLIQRGHLNGLDAETVARIIRSTQRMGRMITQLLDLTRARLGGGFPIDLEDCDLRDVCRSVVDEFDATVIQLDVDGDVTGSWDPDRLAEVLSNVAGNASEHAEPGTAVTVRVRPDGSDVRIDVSNHGSPIPADVLPFIFEPFRGARKRKSPAAGNLGLGLYIAHQIVLSHGGTLEARSADGITNFAVRLPRHPKLVPSEESFAG